MEFKYGMKEKRKSVSETGPPTVESECYLFRELLILYHIVLVIIMMVILMQLLKSLLPLIIDLQRHFRNHKALIYIYVYIIKNY